MFVTPGKSSATEGSLPRNGHDHTGFGYRHFWGSFQEILRIESTHLLYRGKRAVPWANVLAIRSYPDFSGDAVRTVLRSNDPRLTIYLDDGHVLRVGGHGLRRRCDQCSPGRTRDGIPDDYLEMVHALRAHETRQWNGPREEAILFRTMMGFQTFGWLIGVLLAEAMTHQPEASTLLGYAVSCGLVGGALGLLASPFLGTALRKAYLRGMDKGRPGGDPGALRRTVS